MNDNLKVKIWNKEKKEWYYPIYNASQGELFELLLTTDGDIIENTLQGKKHESIFPDRYEVVRYTGLKDRDGKEIYEGDICKYVGTSKIIKEGCKYLNALEVHFSGGFFLIGHNGYGYEGELYIAPNEVEVIGNIYQNEESRREAICQS